MLSKPDAQVAYENGVAVGVTADGETAKAKLVVGDPSYFPDKVRKTSRVQSVLLLSCEHLAYDCEVEPQLSAPALRHQNLFCTKLHGGTQMRCCSAR